MSCLSKVTLIIFYEVENNPYLDKQYVDNTGRT